MRPAAILVVLISIAVIGGCGYTTSSLLPEGLDSIHVSNFANKIDPTKEVSDRRASFSYRPGLEIEITKAVIDAFIFDRHLDIEKSSRSDLSLTGQLVDFRQYPLSYDKNDNVSEFRIEILVEMELYDNTAGKVMWKESNFLGQSSYTITGPNAKTASEALKFAVKDLARRVVERTVEAW